MNTVKKTARRFFLNLFISLLGLCLVTGGCGRSPRQASGHSIGVVLRSYTHPYFVEIEKGIKETAEKNNCQSIVLAPEWRNPDQQTRLLEMVVNSRVKALLIIPETRTNCIPLIVKANSMKIPVIVLDTAVDDEALRTSSGSIDCFITSDNLRGGLLAGEYLAKKLKGKGTILFIEGRRKSYTGILRKKGLNEALREYPGIQIIHGPPANCEREMAFKICKRIFLADPAVNGVFTTSDIMSVGARDAANLFKGREFFIVGYDATEYGIKAVREEILDATITQEPYKMGKIGVETALRLIRGEAVPREILTKTELITKEKLELPFQ